MLSYETQLLVSKLREELKRWSVFIYTGDMLDDLVMMDIEVDSLYEDHQIEAAEYQEFKLTLRRALREAETDRKGGSES